MTHDVAIQPVLNPALSIGLSGLLEATVIARPTRFVALVRLGD